MDCPTAYYVTERWQDDDLIATAVGKMMLEGSTVPSKHLTDTIELKSPLSRGTLFSADIHSAELGNIWHSSARHYFQCLNELHFFVVQFSLQKSSHRTFQEIEVVLMVYKRKSAKRNLLSKSNDLIATVVGKMTMEGRIVSPKLPMGTIGLMSPPSRGTLFSADILAAELGNIWHISVCHCFQCLKEFNFFRGAVLSL